MPIRSTCMHTCMTLYMTLSHCHIDNDNVIMIVIVSLLQCHDIVASKLISLRLSIISWQVPMHRASHAGLNAVAGLRGYVATFGVGVVPWIPGLRGTFFALSILT